MPPPQGSFHLNSHLLIGLPPSPHLPLLFFIFRGSKSHCQLPRLAVNQLMGIVTELSYTGLWIGSEGVAKYVVNWRHVILTQGGKLLADSMAECWPKPGATMEE
jgi:hypothetical protein